MSRKLTGRFEITSVIGIDPTHWTILALFFDETGAFGPSDVAVGQRVFVYSSQDNTLRYKVSAVNSNSSNPVSVVLAWDDSGTAIEPPSGIGAITTVSSTLLLPEEPSFTQQLLDEPLVSGIRSQMTRSQLDTLSPATGGAANTKTMIAFGAVSAGKPASKMSNGKATLSDSDGVDDQTFVGIFLTSGADGAAVSVQLVGANIAGALTGLGFTSGSDIYMSETAGGYTDDISTFTGNNDSILRIGIADCAAGAASAVATDLIMFPEVIARPG